MSATTDWSVVIRMGISRGHWLAKKSRRAIRFMVTINQTVYYHSSPSRWMGRLRHPWRCSMSLSTIFLGASWSCSDGRERRDFAGATNVKKNIEKRNFNWERKHWVMKRWDFKWKEKRWNSRNWRNVVNKRPRLSAKNNWNSNSNDLRNYSSGAREKQVQQCHHCSHSDLVRNTGNVFTTTPSLVDIGIQFDCASMEARRWK